MRALASLFLLAAPAAAQTSIGPNGITAPGVRIDSSGVHTGGATAGGRGVRVSRAGNNTAIDGNDGQRSVNCAGGGLAVRGNGNNVSVANCSSISVQGNRNTVQARFERAGNLGVLGNDNHVAWSAPAGVRVQVGDMGNGNTVSRR